MESAKTRTLGPRLAVGFGLGAVLLLSLLHPPSFYVAGGGCCRVCCCRIERRNAFGWLARAQARCTLGTRDSF